VICANWLVVLKLDMWLISLGGCKSVNLQCSNSFIAPKLPELPFRACMCSRYKVIFLSAIAFSILVRRRLQSLMNVSITSYANLGLSDNSLML